LNRFVSLKTIIFILVILSCKATAQQIDSTKMRLDRIEIAMNHMAYNLRKSGREYTSGILLNLVGGGALTAGIFSNNKSTRSSYFFVGGGVTIIGTVLLISSRYSIARAGKWRFTPTSVEIDF
jgi:hypothetical protein